jgi:corrinoid protein of di/trimethylamine methyltransferase
MSDKQTELHAALAEAVVEMDEDGAAELAQQVVDNGFDAFDAIDQGLAKGMEQAGQLFEEEEYFVPELLICADALNAGVDVLRPHIKQNSTEVPHKIVIGVIQGDTHDIGKNLVKLMLAAAGYQMIDLGRDVAPESFVDAAIEQGAAIIMISSLMTTTMDGMQRTIALLEERGMRDQIKVAVGGGPVSPGFAKRIGADGYSPNANQAVKLANDLVAGL